MCFSASNLSFISLMFCVWVCVDRSTWRMTLILISLTVTGATDTVVDIIYISFHIHCFLSGKLSNDWLRFSPFFFSSFVFCLLGWVGWMVRQRWKITEWTWQKKTQYNEKNSHSKNSQPFSWPLERTEFVWLLTKAQMVGKGPAVVIASKCTTIC